MKSKLRIKLPLSIFFFYFPSPFCQKLMGPSLKNQWDPAAARVESLTSRSNTWCNRPQGHCALFTTGFLLLLYYQCFCLSLQSKYKQAKLELVIWLPEKENIKKEIWKIHYFSPWILEEGLCQKVKKIYIWILLLLTRCPNFELCCWLEYSFVFWKYFSEIFSKSLDIRIF